MIERFSDGTPVPMVWAWEGESLDEMTPEEREEALKQIAAEARRPAWRVA